ncbi:heavy metal sensor histidine kinase [Aquabacterium sp.]|uniref:heavy metal sensor histidine kinase n=1 Tax=Aquabacterium sp. TaxID=1872578 RepID=UPI002489B589|nr:heavy metal sensor histidine kinase [Aquabacterium sp.]MDI1261113.1 heavy metal sensor histidine kinase [Aquabacterium sp.]
MGFDPASGRRPISLALRLTVSIGLTITIVLLAFGWVIETSIERHFVEQDAEELEVVARSVRQVLTSLTPALPPEGITRRLAGAVNGHHGMYYLVADAAGQTLFATPGPDLKAIAHTQPATSRIDVDSLHSWQDNATPYRGAVIHIPSAQDPSQHFTAVLATATGFHDHFLVTFHRTIWAATTAAGLFAILATWLAVYRGHAPLRDISTRIRGISAEQLHLRLAPDKVPIELSGLATSFNAMLEHIERDFKRLSDFSADIAHELRTPVTNLVTQTQVLLTKGRSVDAYREVLYSNLEEYERMAKMIGDMLYLAQTDNKLIKPDLVDVDMTAEVDALFEYFEPLADERHIGLKRQGQIPLMRGDRLMLRRALSNLLSNAIRHTAEHKVITVHLAQDDQAFVVQVANPGDTIPATHLPHLFDRFYRVDPSRQHNGDGAGLGLAIVKSIVDAHGGEISVSSDSCVTVFTLSLHRTEGPP